MSVDESMRLYMIIGELFLIPAVHKYLSLLKNLNKCIPYLCYPFITLLLFIVFNSHICIDGSSPNSPVAINSPF